MPKGSKYSAGQRVVLKDGRSARVVGVDPVSGTYQIITADNRSLRVDTGEIEKAEIGKDSKYQESGPDKMSPRNLTIKDTPFDIDK